jgi:hypothetical protein
VSSGIPLIAFGQLRPGIQFQEVAAGPAGRLQFRRVGLQGWLHGEPYIGTSSPAGERTTSPRETGYPPVVSRGTRHGSRISTHHKIRGFHRGSLASLAHGAHTTSVADSGPCPCVITDYSAVTTGWHITMVLSQQPNPPCRDYPLLGILFTVPGAGRMIGDD